MSERITKTFWSSVTSLDRMISFGLFIQRQADRIQVGEIRYGVPKRRQRYMSRMQVEMDAYKKTGNMEHLLNIANYCWLESEKPENARFYFDQKVDSVTRKDFGV
jgi:hypothetical protein